MKTKQLLITLVSLMMPLLTMAQSDDTWQGALPLDEGVLKGGRLGDLVGDNGDIQDWFKILVPDEGVVTLSVTTETTLRMGSLNFYCLNAEKSDVVYRCNKDMDAHGKDTTIVFVIPDCAPGTYYLRQDRYRGTGGYKIKYNFTACSYGPDEDGNDTWDKATALQLDTPHDGRMGYMYSYTDTYDWYKFEVKEDGKLTFITKTDVTLRLGSLNLYTLNADGTDVVYRCNKDMDGYNKDTVIVFEVPNVSAGVYYVRLDRYRDYGGYTLTCYFTGHSEEADPEPNDTWQEAVELKSGPAVTGQLGYEYNGNTDGTDWYKIVVPKEGAAVLSMRSETTLRLGSLNVYMLNDDGSDVVYRCNKDMDGFNQDTTVVFTIPDLAPGTYYLRQDRYRDYGTYTLQYVFNPNVHKNDPEPNDSWDKASLIDREATQEGCMGYRYYYTDGTDWFKIEVPDEGTVDLHVTAETTLRLGSLNLFTLNDEGTDVVYQCNKDLDNYNKDTTIVFSIPDCAPGTYYLRQDRYRDYGGYKMKYVFTPNSHAADIDGNDSWDKATNIEVGSVQHGRLGYRYNYTDGTDWYRFDVPHNGNVILSVTSDATLRLGGLNLYVPTADGTDVTYRLNKDMDNYNKDTVVVLNLNGMGVGTYYLKQDRYNGYGGYDIKMEFVRSPYDREKLDNGTFANRLKLEEGKTISTTLGYRYIDQNNEDWYDLGNMHGRQIDVTIEPDTTRSLVIGVPALYVYNGDEADGRPNLTLVAEKRLERSAGTISYVDKNDTDKHYVFKVPNYNGSSYGGYTITFGNPESAEGTKQYSTKITVMAGGRNTVRKGVPGENPITVTNMSTEKTGKFLLAIAATDNINILGFRMNGYNRSVYLPIDSVTVMDGGDGERTALFMVPSLDPFESYTFTLISEGKGDIAYTRMVGTTFVAVTVLGYIADAVVGDKIDDFINDQVSATFELDEHEQQQYARCMGTTVQQLGIEKQETGIAAYTVKSVVKKACTDVIELVPGGKIATKVGGALETLQNIVPSIRRRIWYWIYKDLGYIKDDIEVLDGKLIINDVVASWDPNEMVGPAGVGDNHYIADTKTINYRIMFENKAEAGDAAYRVRISDELDENVFDVSSVKFGSTSHDGAGYNWLMKRDGNKLSWDIQGIELPPNVVAPEGEGWVEFSVDLKSGLTDGTQLKNKATIIFDKNYPIETNEFVNTLDLTPPVTTMSRVEKVEGDSVKVVCESADTGSGVESYLLFAAKDDGEYEYQGQYFANEMICAAVNGGEGYKFYVLAVDGVGNTEQIIPEAMATGIKKVNVERPVNFRVYTLDGRYVGDSLKNLRKGVYLIGGKKYIVR